MHIPFQTMRLCSIVALPFTVSIIRHIFSLE